jgi:thiol-disulfide isomerase/thioredoxin
LEDFRAKRALAVLFICNHCPYVKLIRGALAQIATQYQPRGVGFVAINSNDAARYPADAPEKMALEVRESGYSFPYLYDESQLVAKAYRAACTPDIYLFNEKLQLVYRGQFDDSRPSNGLSPTGRDLRAALEATLARQPVPGTQIPSIGCNIKWKPGNEPDYY